MFRGSASILFLALAAAVALHASPLRSQQPAGAATTSSNDEKAFAQAAEQTLGRVCSQCHEIDQVTGQRRTPQDWKDTIDTMVDRGANASDQELADISKYLIRYYGLVHVNTATADDLSSVLGLTPQQASAIVEYRTAHGKFANLTALEQVPGIDTAKLEAQPAALTFD